MNLKATNKKETNKYELEIEISAEEFGKAIDEVYKVEGKKMAIPGFRKGKAPKAFLEKYYGESVFFEGALDKLYRPTLMEAIDKSELEVIRVGEADITAISHENGVEMKVEVVTKPVIDIKDYKGIEATEKKVEITDEDVSAELVKVQDRNSRMITVEDGTAENGDTAVIDFEGFCDGVAFDGGKGENFELSLGSGQFIPGFEEQIVGHKAGDAFDVNVKFPEEYQAEELKGKDSVFKVTVHEIKRKELPVIDDEFAKDVSEFDTLDAYKDSIREKLQKDREAAAKSDVENQLVDALIAKVEGEIPDEMYENEVEESINSFAYRLQSQGLKLETYLQYTGMDVNALKEQFRPQSEKQVKIRLALEKIAELEKLEPTEEEIAKEFERLAEMYSMEADKVKNLVAEDQVKADLASQKAVEFVKENAKVTVE